MSLHARRRRFALLACLLLSAGVLLSAGAQAEEERIYKWMDEKGQIHFTATPPPSNARPIAPKPQEKGPIQIVPMPASSTPSSSARSSARPRERARSLPRTTTPTRTQAVGERVDCGRYTGPLQRVRQAQETVNNLESSIERLENDAVSSTRTSCNRRGELLGVCSDSSYNRDRELERTRERLTAAEQALADAEGELRAADVPRECLNKD